MPANLQQPLFSEPALTFAAAVVIVGSIKYWKIWVPSGLNGEQTGAIPVQSRLL
jgi:hypothetical protein